MTPSPHLTLVVVAAALTVQCFAVAAALRLLVITRHGWAWGCVSVALLLMAIRRGLTLWQGVGEAQAVPADIRPELLGLAISVVLCLGLVLLTQVARETNRRREQSKSIADRYRTVFEQHPAVMLLVDPVTSTIVDVNPAAAAYYGYPREALRQVPTSRLWESRQEATGPSTPGASPPIAHWLSRRAHTARHRLADGQVRDVEVRAGIFNTESTQLLYLVVHDEGDRLASEQDQAEHAAFSRHNPSPLVRVDRQGVVLFANLAARRYGIEAGHPLVASIGRFGELPLESLIAHGLTQVLEAEAGDRVLQLTVHGRSGHDVADVYTTDVTLLRRAGDALRESNEELRRWVGELERHRHDSDAHIELSALLQSCESVEEAGHVIERLVPTLFPDSSGAIFLDLPQTSVLQSIGQWGPHAPASVTFHRDTCWAVRRGQPHAVEEMRAGLTCPHLMDGYEGYSVCLPLRAQGAMPGVLTLRGDGRLRDASGQRQARMLTDTVGLAIVNLRLREGLREQSIRDGLTGLFNRRYLEETLALEVSRAAREQSSLAILMIDLDHFKVVNDTFGHATGDRVLRALADMLQRQVRSADIVCRYGGEEFAVLMPDTALEHAIRRAEELRQAARALELPAPASNGSLSISVGVAVYPNHGRRASDLVRASDAALYAAKRNGRDRVETPPPAEPPPDPRTPAVADPQALI